MYSLLFFHGYPSYVGQSEAGRRALVPFRICLFLSMLPFVIVIVAWLLREETRLWGGAAGLIVTAAVWTLWRFRWPDMVEEAP